jgi:hypothetical protein
MITANLSSVIDLMLDTPFEFAPQLLPSDISE